LIANVWRGCAEAKSFCDWATDQLTSGRDGVNLRILAGLGSDDTPEIQTYLAKTLAEMGWRLPDRQECLIQYCGDVARKAVNGTLPPITALGVIGQIDGALQYPAVLRYLHYIEALLTAMQDHGEPLAEQERMAREACTHFLLLLENYTETGLARVSMGRSFEVLRARGLGTPSSATSVLRHIPVIDGEDDGEDTRLTFFRTRLEKQDFRDLTVPWTLFLRSEITHCQFENTDLSESSMTWCDWSYCNFAHANLRGCDLRRSIFSHCEFYDANLEDADLRGARFVQCRFNSAIMKGAKLEKAIGFLATLRGRRLALSNEQTEEITWCTTAGEEPPGG
jgi:uncharacterized protein YjbI with pentapeptide repeats